MRGFSSKPAVWITALLLAGAAVLLFSRLAGERVPAYLVEQGEMRQSVVASGRVRTPQRIELAAQVTGRVTTVNVAEGARIAAAQILLRLDDSELRAARDQAQASLAQSEARLYQLSELSRPLAEQGRRQADANWQQAKKQFARTRKLVERGLALACDCKGCGWRRGTEFCRALPVHVCWLLRL